MEHTRRNRRAKTGRRISIPKELPAKMKAYRNGYGFTHNDFRERVETVLGQPLSNYAVAGIENGKGERCGKLLRDAIEKVVCNGSAITSPDTKDGAIERVSVAMSPMKDLAADTAMFNKLTDSFNKMSTSDRKTLVTVANRFATDADIQDRYLRLKDSVQALTRDV